MSYRQSIKGWAVIFGLIFLLTLRNIFRIIIACFKFLFTK